MQTAQGLRALSKDEPADPESVQRCLESKFAESLPYVEDAGRWQACLLRQVSVRRRSPPRCVQPYLNPVHALWLIVAAVSIAVSRWAGQPEPFGLW